ncbi:MAG: TetR/AcrR family transcriptional regulator [Paracoccaceae bacterium]|nr:TetR/AcrR family transcriptional regulator [Paracoccaceae bacterium]
MGRRKSYNRNELIAKAMTVFREHGFAGASADMLVEKLGVNRYSLYAEFGSKQGLFDAALERYEEEFVGRRFGPLERPDAGLNEIRALLAFYGERGPEAAGGLGCLLCNTAVEFGPLDPSGAGFVQAYFERLFSAFKTALSNAKAGGALRPGADIESEAGFFTSSVIGMFVMLRAKAPEAMLKGASNAAIAHLEWLRV